MTKSTKKTKATHNTRPASAKLETPKGKPAAAPVAEHQKVIRAECFELVDAQGNERACLKLINDHAVLAMHDSRGKLRLTMRAGLQTAILSIFSDREGDTDVVERVEIGYGEGVHGPSVIISDGDGDRRVILSDNGAQVFDPNGEPNDDAQDEDDELPPFDTEEAVRSIARFIADPANGRIDSDLWPQRLTLGQMLYQCGYLIRGIICHPDAPADVRDAMNGLVAGMREKLEAKDGTQLTAIDAGATFAPVALALGANQGE